jgi:hypothetical protein
MREGSDAREALEEVEGDALAFEKRAGRADDGGDADTFVDTVAVAMLEFELFDTAAHLINDGEEIDAGEDQRFACEEEAGCASAFGYAGLGRDVARTDVFGQSALDGVDDLRMH